MVINMYLIPDICMYICVCMNAHAILASDSGWNAQIIEDQRGKSGVRKGQSFKDSGT